MNHHARRAIGLVATGSVVAAATTISGLGAVAQPSPSVDPHARLGTRPVVIRPDGVTGTFTPYGGPSAASALGRAINRPTVPPVQSGIRSARAGQATIVVVAGLPSGTAKPTAAAAWYYASTGSGSSLLVEVLQAGVPVAASTLPAKQTAGWRSVAVKVKDASSVAGLQLRFTSIGGASADVRVAYVAVTAGSATKLLRPVADVGPFSVVPSGSAAAAVDDQVEQPRKPTAVDYLHAIGVRSTTVTLGHTSAGSGTAGGSAWFYANTGSGERLRVDVVSSGRIQGSMNVAPSQGGAWRRIALPAGNQGMVDDLQLRFSAMGTGSSDVRAAYAEVEVVDNSHYLDDFLLGLKPVRSGPAVPRHPIGGTTASTSEALETPPGDDRTGKARFQCNTTPVESTQSPDQIVIQDPDVNKMWLGAMLQGRGYAGGPGSLVELHPGKRAPLTIFLTLAGRRVTKRVEDPNAANMQQAISDLMLDAQADGTQIPANISFQKVSEESSEEGLIDAGISAKYLGSSVIASLKSTRSAKRSALRVDFEQRMYSVAIVAAPDGSPSSYFDKNFSATDLDRLVARGEVGADNPPVIISHITYGRMLHFSVTSTATQEELEGAIKASYEAAGNGGSANFSDRQKAIVQQAEYKVFGIGGPVSNMESLIKTGHVDDYFAAPASIVTARPLSYQVDNMNGTTAAFSETTTYDLRTCRAIPNTAVLDSTVVAITPPKFYPDSKREHVDLYGGIDFQGTSIWNRIRDEYQTVTNRVPTTMTQMGTHNSGLPLHPDNGEGRKFWIRQLPVDGTGRLRIEGTANCILWFPEIGEGSNKFDWTWDVRSGAYGEQEIDGGSRTCDTKLKFQITKIQDNYIYTP